MSEVLDIMSFYNRTGCQQNPNKTISNETVIREEALVYLKTEERTIFFIIFLFIYIVAFTANFFAIYTTLGKNYRLIQKTCIISLAVSDLVMATAYAINHLETLSHPLMNWTTGEMMCKIIPMLQITGLIANSITLVVIALDRYQNVVHALKKRWNPELWKCIIGISVLWIISIGISSPMSIYYKYYPIKVFYSNYTLSTKQFYMCLANSKDSLYHFYFFIIVFVFFPMLTIFTFLYYNIAKLIWSHRKPMHLRFQKKFNATPETSISNIKSNEDISSVVKDVEIVPKKKNIHVERKIRTFKIIVALMLVFICCRLPFWIFTMMKLTYVYNESYHWILGYSFTALTLLNCALNPFLYTFLDATVKSLGACGKAMNDFFCKVCCCCFSNTEFEDFEKENPFVIENYQRTKSQSSSRKVVDKEVKFHPKFLKPNKF